MQLGINRILLLLCGLYSVGWVLYLILSERVLERDPLLILFLLGILLINSVPILPGLYPWIKGIRAESQEVLDLEVKSEHKSSRKTRRVWRALFVVAILFKLMNMGIAALIYFGLQTSQREDTFNDLMGAYMVCLALGALLGIAQIVIDWQQLKPKPAQSAPE